MIDLELIKKQVKEVLEYSQGIKNAKVDYLIDTWYESKRELIELIGDNLIYSTPNKITVDLTEKEKNVKIDDFCAFISRKFPQYKDLFCFVRENEKDFFKNILSKTYDKDGYYIPAGIKFFKAFKEFVDNKEDLDDIQTEASRVIQEGKISGYLCVSVHPLDYLSSSENNYNWRSCHSLDGEYRAGNLSYMLDKSTLVCYICGKKQVKLPRFPMSVPWNDKKWRMLLFISDNKDALFAGRQYPFFSKSLMEEIRFIWINNFSNSRYYHPWSNWHNDFFQNIDFKEWGNADNFSLPERYIPIRNEIKSMSDLISDSKTELHFNDLTQSSLYIPYYCWRNYSRRPIHFTIGHDVKCIKCEDTFIYDHESMMCEDCLENNGYVRCGDCGEMIRLDDAIYIDSEDRYICEHCYEEYYTTCAECGEVFHNDDIYYDEERDCYLCSECYNMIN